MKSPPALAFGALALAASCAKAGPPAPDSGQEARDYLAADSDREPNVEETALDSCPDLPDAAPAPPTLKMSAEVACSLEIHPRNPVRMRFDDKKSTFATVGGGEGTLHLPTDPTEDAFAELDIGDWAVAGFVPLADVELSMTYPLLLGGVIVPRPKAVLALVIGAPGKITVRYIAPEDDKRFKIESELSVEGEADCDMVAAGRGDYFYPSAPIGERIGSRYLLEGHSTPISTTPDSPPVLHVDSKWNHEVSVLGEAKGFVRIIVPRESDWIVGWTAESHVTKERPTNGRTRTPQINMGSTPRQTGKFRKLLQCPHPQSLVAEVNGARRTIGRLRSGSVAGVSESEPLSGTETLLAMEGVSGVDSVDGARWYLQHRDLKECTCWDKWRWGK